MQKLLLAAAMIMSAKGAYYVAHTTADLNDFNLSDKDHLECAWCLQFDTHHTINIP